jgi:hydrogenase maturation protease
MVPLASTAVIGIGNEFRQDDGVGPATVALLRTRVTQRLLPSDTVHVQCDGDPGRLITLRGAHAGRHSTHGLGLAEAVRLGDSLGRVPGRLVVYAVEGADRSLGIGLSPAVSGAVERLTRRIEADIGQYVESSAPGLRAE